jgi:type VI secretion system protein VasI
MSENIAPARSTVFAILLLFGLGRTAHAQTSSATGLWQDSSYIDNLTGKKVVETERAPTSDTDNDVERTRMIIRCGPDGTSNLVLTWDQRMENDTSAGTVRIDYRIGGIGVQSENWLLSTDDLALFYPYDIVPEIGEFETSNVLVARIFPTGMDEITATYDTTGLNNAVEPVLKACGVDQ